MPLLGFDVQSRSELPVFIESDDVKFVFRQLQQINIIMQWSEKTNPIGKVAKIIIPLFAKEKSQLKFCF